MKSDRPDPPRAVCRVAVVDDDPLELEEMVRGLRAAVLEYDLGKVEVEPFSDARDVARSIDAAGVVPPWDVILADVLMPDVQSGGFLIARAIRERYAGAEVPVKLALVTRRAGYLSAFRPFREFSVAETADWFWFFVKEEGGEPAEAPLLPVTVWKRALAQMIRLRDTERWGFRPLRSMEELGVVREALRSPAATDLLTVIANLGGNPRIRVVVLSAEPGSDLLSFAARLLHFHRAEVRGRVPHLHVVAVGGHPDRSLGAALFGSTPEAAGAVERPGRLEMAAGGTLFIDRADALPVEEWRALLGTLSTRQVARWGDSRVRAFEADLVVLGVSPATAADAGDPLQQLRSRPDTAFVRVPPLSERSEDVIPVAEAVLEGLAMDAVPALSDDAASWLRDLAQSSSLPFQTLTELVKLASDYGTKRVVTRADLADASRWLQPGVPGAGSDSPVSSPAMGRISVLFVLASPTDQPRLRLGEEVKRVRDAMKAGKARGRFSRVEVCLAATDRDVQRALLEEDWTIVHFSGHATRAGLLLEDEAGTTRRLPVEALARMLAQHRDTLQCVILNACSTRRQGQRIACEVPCVIASPTTIEDPHAIRFAEAFYDALAAGRSAEFAYDAGIVALSARVVPKRRWPEVVRCSQPPGRRALREPGT